MRALAASAPLLASWLALLPALAAGAARAQGAPDPDGGVSQGESATEDHYGAIAIAPAPGMGVPLDKVPRNVQRLDSTALAEDQPLGLHDALAAHLGSVVVNDVQNNPLQPDFQYRGFTASPLLGTPQGLTVYQDGVRLNEPFGDLVQWDLVPVFAISEVDLLPGANPVYGLNALGGSLVLRMKNGFRDPGYRISALAGSFGRYQTSAEYGQAFGALAVYAGVAAFGEQGFRDQSASSARSFHADVRQADARQEIGVSATLGSSRLAGNGPAPVELLARDRQAVYTFPDDTRNDSLMVAVHGQRRLLDRVALQGTLYSRHALRSTDNGDAADFAACGAASARGSLCDQDGSPLRTETQAMVAASAPFDALVNRTRTASDGQGGSLQLSVEEPFAALPNQLVVGASYDGAQIEFEQRAELAQLTGTRRVEGAGTFLDGEGNHTRLDVQNHLLGSYVADTLELTPELALSAAARFDWARSGLDDLTGGSLTSSHVFTRVNPALGFTYEPVKALTLFGGYGEASRAPSAAELGCADPDHPCRVPNAFLTDPPLAQVVSRSVELGLRGHAGPRRKPWLEGSLAGFASRNAHDILFVAGSHVGTGYFRNAGTTQRVGLEATLSGRLGRVLRWFASYALLRATFESELELPGTNNPAVRDVGGTRVLDVSKGDRIPGLPTHSLKAGASVQPLPRLELGLSAIAHSSQPFRGDEANLLSPLAGYVVLDGRASYRMLDTLTLLLKVHNLLDTKYETFGVLGNPAQVLPGMTDPRFTSPGAPLGVWAGVLLHDR